MSSQKKHQKVLTKPSKYTISYYDLFEVVEYIHEKYDLDTYNYFKVGDHFKFWLKEVGEESPKGFRFIQDEYRVHFNGIWTVVTKEEYDAVVKEVHEQYQRYLLWAKVNPEVEPSNFWEWLSKDRYIEFRKDSYISLSVKDLMDELSEDDWKYDILNTFYKEFGEDTMEFHVYW